MLIIEKSKLFFTQKYYGKLHWPI